MPNPDLQRQMYEVTGPSRAQRVTLASHHGAELDACDRRTRRLIPFVYERRKAAKFSCFHLQIISPSWSTIILGLVSARNRPAAHRRSGPCRRHKIPFRCA